MRLPCGAFAAVFLLLISGCHGWTTAHPSRRRAIVEASSLVAGLGLWWSPTAAPPALAADTTIKSSQDYKSATGHVSQQELLQSMIPVMPCGAPATNATIPAESLVNSIEQLALALETNTRQRNNAISPLLAGNSWRLVYSNAPEIANLAANLPLGLCLGKTYQPITTQLGIFENQSPIKGIAKVMVTVVGDLQVAPPGALNAVNVANDRNNRVTVQFRAITFELQELLGFKLTVQKTLIPNNTESRAAPPANDVTYLDDQLRIVRGGDGSLFIFVREDQEDDGDVPLSIMLSKEQREALLLGQKRGEKVNVGIGVAEKSKSPELQFLFQQRRRSANRSNGD